MTAQKQNTLAGEWENDAVRTFMKNIIGHAFRVTMTQCLKCLIPVMIMAIPCSSAALTTSASRMEPPG